MNATQQAQLLAQAQSQYAQALASGNPVAIAASKQALNKLSMTSLHDLTPPASGPGADYLNLADQLEKNKSDKKSMELNFKELQKEKEELQRDIKALKGALYFSPFLC